MKLPEHASRRFLKGAAVRGIYRHNRRIAEIYRTKTGCSLRILDYSQIPAIRNALQKIGILDIERKEAK